MSYLREVSIRATFPSLAQLQELFGTVPNLFRAQTLLPRLIEAEAGIVAAVLLDERTLSRSRKEFIMLAVAAAYGNSYCFIEHHEKLRSLGIPDHYLDQIVNDHHQAGLSTPNTILLDFALKLAVTAPWLSGDDIALLREHGFADESILEVILVVALTDFLCTLATGLGPSPDFEPRRIPGSPNESPQDPRSYVGGTAGPYLRAVELSPESFPPFAFFLERFGFIPSLFLAQTLRPDVIGAEADAVQKMLMPEDDLSHLQKECILLVGSAANLNSYCVAAHCEMLRRMGSSMEEADQIAVDHRQAELSDADKGLLDFVLKLTARPSEFRREDIELLRSLRFTDEQVLEAVAVTALNKFFNRLQMGLGTIPDFEATHIFGPNKKHPPPPADRLRELAGVDPDAGLVARVQNGDLDAFEELVTRHTRRVFRTLLGIVGIVEEAQDAMQDTFLKAFKYIGSFEGRSKFSTWLLMIASNTGIQRLRERNPLESLDDARTNAEEEFRPRQVRSWADNPEQLYSKTELRELIEREIMRLPAKYRLVLMLRDIEQLSTEEASAALGLPIPALKSRVCRARLMLRESLAPHFAASAKRMGL